MTFDDVMKKYNGKWENDRAIIQAEGGYYWIIATGSPENFMITSDGRRFVTAETPQAKIRSRRKAVDKDAAE